MSTSTVADGDITGDDLLAIRDLVQRAQNSQQDAHALPELHTEGAVIVNLAGRRVFGATGLALAMQAALSSSLRDVLTSVDIIDVRRLGRETAVVSCIKTVHDQRTDAGGDQMIPAHGALTYVVHKVDSVWRIAVAQTTPISQ